MLRKLLGSIFALLLCAGTSYAQVKVTGTVTDAQGVLPGATVILQGTTKGTITDAEGQFSLDIPDAANAVLDVRFMGMDPVLQPLGGRTYIEVRMSESASQLDEVVAMGYGLNVRKGDVSGAISTISGDVLAMTPVTGVGEALAGKLAGVQVTSVDGSPDAAISIRVRGGGSISASPDANDPLIIVDGFPVDNLNGIPVSEIENVSVLKDASTTALYGARGANGVVVVTTKQAKGGKTQISVDSYASFRSLARALDVMDPYQFVLLQFENARLKSSNTDGFNATFGHPQDLYIYKGIEGTNWQKEAMKGSPITHNHSVSMNGGNEKTRFMLNLTYHNEQGVLISNGLQRLNLNFKFNHQISDKLRFDFNTRFATSKRGGGGTGDSRDVGGVSIRNALRYRPTEGLIDFMDVPVINEFGDEEEDPLDPTGSERYSPKQDAKLNWRKQVDYLFNASSALNWTIAKGVTARSEFGIDFFYNYDDRYYGGQTTPGTTYSNGLPLLELTTGRKPKIRWANTISYAFDVENHHFKVTGGQEIISGTTLRNFNRIVEFPQDIDPQKAIDNLALGAPHTAESSRSAPNRMASFFGNLIYDWDRRFFLTATLRTDGSTLFGPDNRWGLFPAASASWNLANEAFIKKIPQISDLRLRMSYGASGNNRIGDDKWRSIYLLSTAKAPGWGEKFNEYYAPGDFLPNPGIKWETTITRNIGLDVGLFEQRLSGQLEVYWNSSKDLLYESLIPAVSGFPKQQENIAQTSNKGVELTLNGQIVKQRDFNLSGTFNIGVNKFMIDKLNNGSDWEEFSSGWAGTSDIVNTFDYRVVVGKSLGLIYGFKLDGFYKVEDFDYDAGSNTYTLKPGVVNSNLVSGTPRPGNAKFKKLTPVDESAENPYDITIEDRDYIGDTNPDFSGGIGLNGNYKNFDFYIFANFMYGFDVYNATKATLHSFRRNSYNNVAADVAGRFRYFDDMGNDLRTDPVLLAEFNKNATIFNPISLGKEVAMDYIVEDGSFLRLQNVTLGYTLPARISRKIGMNRLRIYATGYNLWLWTKYSGYDPEVNVQRGLTPGLDHNAYPRSTTYTLGVNISF